MDGASGDEYLFSVRVYVDLDDTLIHAVYGKGRGVGKRTVIDAGEGEYYHSFLRPDAHYMLEEMRRMGEVWMLTTAKRSYAMAHNETFRLGFSGGEILAREDYIVRVPMAYSSEWMPTERGVCPHGILVDNLSPAAEAARLKMAYLGIGEERYVQIREFNGRDPDNFKGELAQILTSLELKGGGSVEDRTSGPLCVGRRGDSPKRSARLASSSRS